MLSEQSLPIPTRLRNGLPTSNGQLSTREEEEFALCERTIESGLGGFFEVGLALLRIRENKLYRRNTKPLQRIAEDGGNGARVERANTCEQSK
jgi:hypothetical protein